MLKDPVSLALLAVIAVATVALFSRPGPLRTLVAGILVL